jgi:ribosomal protein S18 acetylase RimI-like enzyme
MINYRCASILDIGDIIDLRLDWFCESESCEKRESYAKTLKEFLLHFILRDGIFYIAIDSETKKVVATCGLLVTQLMPRCDDNGIHGILFDVYTKPEYRGSGIQTQLLKYVLEIADTKDISEISLEVSNPTAISIYEKLGFAFDKDIMVRRRIE